MYKLISAGFLRLLKDKIFRFICAGFFIYSAFILIMIDTNVKFEEIFFAFAAIISIPIAIFCGMFIGTEYSDGTIRNKIIVGHSRSSVYFSILIVNVIACILIVLSYTLATLLFGVPKVGFFGSNAQHILSYIFATFMMLFALCSIYTLICLIITNKASSAVICVLVAFALIIASTIIKSQLEEAKFIENSVYQFLYDFIPTCQGVQIAMQTSDEPWKLSLYSTGIVIITSTLGMLLFRKKDLK